MKKNLQIFKILFLLTLFLPFSLMAFDFYVDDTSKNLQRGEPSVIKLMLDTKGQEINAIEGKIKVPNDLNGITLDTGGSVFTLWPEKPEMGEGSIIHFTGGVSGGVYGKDLRVFNINFIPQISGVYNFEIQELNLYLSDGEGTKISKDNQTISFNVLDVDDTKQEINKDKQKPSNLIIELGRDENLYDGQYFITFHAIDSGSGINRYEVKEGDSKFVDYNSNTYIIKDQSLNTSIYIKAIDNEGNEITEVLKLGESSSNYLNIILITLGIIIILIVSVILFKKIINKNEN